MTRLCGAGGLLGAVVALCIAVSQAVAALGNGCSDGIAVPNGNVWDMVCLDGGCPPGETCCVYESVQGNTTMWECVCDPTPAGGGQSDESGDETSEIAMSLCKSRLKRTGAGAGAMWSMDCFRITCRNECQDGIKWVGPPWNGWVWICDCP
jgi:hypothetical protein